jgi:multiple antibiotic resistance protein
LIPTFFATMTLVSAALLLFLVMDPLGNIPLFLTALNRVAPERRRHVVLRELLIALGVLVFFLFSGRFALDLLQISEPALSVSGGVILLMIAVRMVFPSHNGSMAERIDQEPFVVPLAIPYVAGPSALATCLLIMSREPDRWPVWLLALLLAWVASSIILYFASSMRRFFSERGLTAVERLMGMVLVTISVQMMMTGIDEFLAR